METYYSHLHDQPVVPGLEPPLTQPQREYLAEIYRIHDENGGNVPTNLLAERLNVSPPAAVKMIRRLVCDGYCGREPYKGVTLTDKGVREALREIRSHRLVERFLVDVMNFGWHEAHAYAHDFEDLSEEVEDRMDLLCGHPTRCPHGEPIPTKDGQIEVINDVSMAKIEPGTAGKISRIKSHSADKLLYLSEIQMIPGQAIEVINRAPFNGPIRVKINGRDEQVVGAELAADIWVE